MRAFERMSGPRASGSRALALALVMLVFASGFLLGRVGSMGPSGGPIVSALPASKPLAIDDAPDVKAITGSISYLVNSRESLATIASHDLYTGIVGAEARISAPVELDAHATTRVVAFERSVAVIAADAERSYVAMASHNQPPHAWIPGVEAAWASERELFVRNANGSVDRWTVGSDAVRAGEIARADQLIQTAAGPVVRRGSVLETVRGPERRLAVPSKTRVLAVSPDLTRALIDGDPPSLWDGEDRVPMSTGEGDALGASFDRSSERVAIVLRTQDALRLALMDVKGIVSLKPLGGGSGCDAAPVWDSAAKWVYVAGGEGVMHAVEATGGRIGSTKTQAVGCGVAWVDTA
jgi:hypothetical protein